MPLKYEQPVNLTASIYRGPDRSTLLFEFVREARRSGATLDVQRDYTYPDGRLAVREHVVYHGDQLALYELDDKQTGSTGRAVVQHDPGAPDQGRIEFEYSKAGGRPSIAQEALKPDTVVNDMIAPFLLDHWATLLRGDGVKCHCLVVPRKETVGFILSLETGANRQAGLLTIKMEPTNPIFRRLVEPIYFTIEKEPPHHILEYTGRISPKLKTGHGWKDLNALTVFRWK